MVMNNPGASAVEGNRQHFSHQAVLISLRSSVTTSNLIGLIGTVFALFLLLALPEPWNMRLPCYLVLTVWTMLRPRVALYLMPFAVPWGSIDIIDVGGLHLNSADILVVLLAAAWFMSFALLPTGSPGATPAGPRDHDTFNIPRYLLFATLLLLSTMLLSMLAAINISSSLKEVSKWLEFLILLLLGAQYLRTRRQIWLLILLICLAGITQAFYGYIQAFFDIGPSAFIRDASLRVYGTFDQPNPYAGYINIPLSIALALMLLGSNWVTRILAGAAVLLLAGAEYLTQSRGGELAIAAVLLFIVIVGMPRIRMFIGLLTLAGLGITGFFLAGWIPQFVLTPLLRILGLTQISLTAPGTQDFSTAERLAHWIAGVHMFLDHPFIGTGIGNYPDAYPQYFITIFINPLGHAHNYYINIAAETGSIGLTAFLLFLYAIFLAGGSSYQHISKKFREAKADSSQHKPETRILPGTFNKVLTSLSIRPIHKQEREKTLNMLSNDRALALGLLAAFISVCVHNLVDDLYVHSLTNLIALLLIALIRLEEVTR